MHISTVHYIFHDNANWHPYCIRRRSVASLLKVLSLVKKLPEERCTNCSTTTILNVICLMKLTSPSLFSIVQDLQVFFSFFNCLITITKKKIICIMDINYLVNLRLAELWSFTSIISFSQPRCALIHVSNFNLFLKVRVLTRKIAKNMINILCDVVVRSGPTTSPWILVYKRVTIRSMVTLIPSPLSKKNRTFRDNLADLLGPINNVNVRP